MEQEKLYCGRCNVELETKKLNLEYLGHPVTNDFLCCPVCGEPYIPEEIVNGRMREVETLLEDK